VGKKTNTQHKTILWLLDLIRRCKNKTAHRRELCIIIIIIADAVAQDRTRSPEFSRNPNTNVATKKCAGRRACVRACVVAGATLSLSQDQGLFGFASLPYLQIFSIFTFSKEFFFFLFGVKFFFSFFFSFLFLAVF
jgi:hypothetical protein